MADLLKVSIEITHHVRKPAHGQEAVFTFRDSRSAVALTNAGSFVRVINFMAEKDVALAGITTRCAYIRLEPGGMANYSPDGGEVRWLQHQSVILDHFDGTFGLDSVGVLAE